MDITLLSSTRKFFLSSFLIAGSINFSSAQTLTFSPDEIIPVKLEGVSKSLKDVPEYIPSAKELSGPIKEHENESLENKWLQGIKENPDALPKGADPALQRDYSSRTKGGADQTTGWTNLLSTWAGLTTSIYPSDNCLAVGPNHVMQITNAPTSTSIRIWNKAGTVLVTNKLISSITGITDGGDPNVIYDEQADRFVFIVLGATSSQLVLCVSKTGDPTGAYYFYTFNASNGFPDYPKIAVWDNSYFVTTNSNSPTIFALNRTTMLAGTGTGVAQVFQLSSFPMIGFQAASPISQTGSIAPAPGTPATMIRVADDAWGTAAAPDHLELFKLVINWTTPSLSTITGPIKLNTIPYNSSLCGFGASSCIPMKGTLKKLDPLSDIIMDKAQYRNLGGYESIVCSHVCNADGAGTAGIRWYELRKDTTGAWSIFQQSTYAIGTDSRFMSSISINDAGTIALGYNISSLTMYPGSRITGRNACDSINKMTIPETIIKTGTVASSTSRYGDYNAVVTDPSDGSFWFTANYNPASSWSTSVSHFTFSDCSTLPVASYTSTSTLGCDSLCVTFTDASQGDTSRLWLFPGGSPATSSLPSPVVCYLPGTYSISLIAVNGNGTDTLVHNNCVTVSQPFQASITASGDSLVSSLSKSYQWYDSSGAITGAISKTFIAHHSGYYHVCTQDSFTCRSCSDSIYLLVSGVNDLLSQDGTLQLYPNPVSKAEGVLSLSSSKDIRKGEINIFNVMAEKVFSESFSGKTKTVNLNLSEGVYFIQVKDEERQYVRKIIVQ